MNSASQLWHREQQVNSSGLTTPKIGERIWSCVQFLWLAVTFLLFLVLGPFASIAVIPAVFSLAGNLQDVQEPTAVRQNR
ncbi:MAG: hypothetical protein HGA96_13265 [Desulfobulbaceae bacterium]|nr:hypothetical protein [Desulfobulbaceae bacterium]